MTHINKSEIINELIRKLRLDPGLDRVPKDIADKILPVVVVNENGISRQITDATLNSNSKTFVVPLGMKWKIDQISAIYTADATVGSRAVFATVSASVGGAAFARYRQEFSITASQVGHLHWSSAWTTESFNGTEGYASFLPFVYEGMEIQIHDNSDIASTDDFTVTLFIRESSMEA